MLPHTLILALVIGAVAAPVAAQDEEAQVEEMIQPLIAKCPEVSAMVERWKASPPGALAKLVTSWRNAPVIERRYFGGWSTEMEWGGWRADNKQKWGGAAFSEPVLGGRMIVDVFSLSRDNNVAPDWNYRKVEDRKMVGVTGPQDGGFVSLLVHDDSPDCFVMQGTQVGEEIHFVGERGRRTLGVRSHSLELSAADGAKTLEIAYERAKSEIAASIVGQAGCLEPGSVDCTSDESCCGAVCVEEKSEGTSYDGKPMIVYQNFCR